MRRQRLARPGPTVLTLPAEPGLPRIHVLRLRPGSAELLREAHAHDYLVVGAIVRDGGSLVAGASTWSLQAGDLLLLAPGEVFDPSGMIDSDAWLLFFAPDVVARSSGNVLLAWRAHPLLLPFVSGDGVGVRHLRIPQEDRPRWWSRFELLADELRENGALAGSAITALVTLLLVDVARAASDAVAGLRLNDEPLLGEVFRVIEDGYTGSLSLRDVAGVVHLTPAHLTTVVRRRTGRTVGDWIEERRMAEARRLLTTTDLTVAEIAQRCGFDDAGYFSRRFRRSHGSAPAAWRTATVVRTG